MRLQNTLRPALGVAMAIAGLFLVLPIWAPDTQDTFEGGISVIPAQPDVDARIEISFEPDDPQPAPGVRGDLRIRLSNDAVADDVTETSWVILLTGGAMFETASLDGATDATSVSRDLPKRDFLGVTYQRFEFSAPNGVTFVGRATRSPMSGDPEVMTLTMPAVLTPTPLSGPASEGGLIAAERLSPGMIMSLRWDAEPQWQHPDTVSVRVDGGYTESRALTVVQSSPELQRDKWGNELIWEPNGTLRAVATIKNEDAIRDASLRSGSGFFLLGVGVPLMLDMVGRRRTQPAVQVEVPPSTVPRVSEAAAPASASAASPQRSPASKPSRSRHRRRRKKRR